MLTPSVNARKTDVHVNLQIEYKGKGYFSGKSHTFKATLKPPTSSDKTQIVEGTWHTTSKTANGVTFHDVTPPKEEVTVKPIEEQDEWESRRLWSAVAKGIRECDFESASREKSRIEVCSDLLQWVLGSNYGMLERTTPETEG
jgi:hypothetical protein